MQTAETGVHQTAEVLAPVAARVGVPAGVRRPAREWWGSAPAVFLGVFCAATGLTEAIVRLGHVPAFIFPPPSAVLAELAHQPGLYASNALVTLYEAGAGLLAGALVAFVVAVVSLHSPLLNRALTPFVVVSQTIPVIALAPLLVLWLGYGALPRVVICALIAFFPMTVSASQGFRSTDPQLLLLLRSLGASRWNVFWRVRLPGAAPFLVAGTRTGVTLSLVGAVVAEWTGSDHGLGYLVLSANARLATTQAFAAILVITLLGVAAYGSVALLERRLCWWAAPAGERLSWRRKGPRWASRP
jgi:NitT/TauT family transport system permease protein